MFKGLVIGRIVRMHMLAGDAPAIVTQVLDKTKGVVSVQVFRTRDIDARHNVAYSETKEVGCWSWPPREE